MKKHNYYRFIISEAAGLNSLAIDDEFVLTDVYPDLLHQLTKVLRVTTADEVILLKENFDSSVNHEFVFSVSGLDKKHLKLKLLRKKKIQDVLDRELGLSFALPNKPAKLEEVLQHCTELGTTQFNLFKGDYSNYHHQINEKRLLKILVEAVEQSERARVPRLHFYKDLDAYLEDLQRTCLVALERNLLQENILEMNIEKGVDLLVGPEGGFSEREIALIKSYQLRTFTLGKQVLRNETSAILATGILSLKMQSSQAN